MKRLPVVLALFALTSCESSVHISYRLEGPTDSEADTCALTLQRASDGYKLANLHGVGKEFHDTLLISPLPKEYYVTIACDGFESFKSSSYKMPPRLFFSRREERQIDLGSVALDRKPDNRER
jgi:hypothetical protein